MSAPLKYNVSGRVLTDGSAEAIVAYANGLPFTASGRLAVDGLSAVATDYKGLWDASANTPDLTVVGAAGEFYIVSVAGTFGGVSYDVGDWIISDGTSWEKYTPPSDITTTGLPNIKPSLLLDFANSKTVDPRITYACASPVPYYDGRTVVKAEENLLLNSAVLVTQSRTVIAGDHTLSFTGTGTVTLSGASTSGPLVGTGVDDRVDLTFTTTAGSLTLTVSGDVRLAQLEQRDFVTAYTPTTTQPITRYQPKLLSAPANTPVIDHGPVTGECLGLASWGQATNRALYARDFSNAAWVKTDVSVTTGQIGLDGTAAACLLTATAANGTIIQDLGVVASALKTGEVYLKRYAGSGAVEITLNGGTTWIPVTITSTGYTKVRITGTLADEDFGIRLVVPGDAVFADYGGVFTGDYAGPPIKTEGSQVTRAATSCFVSTSNWLKFDSGTLCVDFQHKGSPIGTGSVASIGSASASTSRFMSVDITSAGGLQAVSTSGLVFGTVTLDNFYKVALSVSSSGAIAASSNGGNAITQTVTPSTEPRERMSIGSLGGVSTRTVNAYIKKIAYYPTASTATELEALTS